MNSFAMVPRIKSPTNAVTCLLQLPKNSRISRILQYRKSFFREIQSRSAQALRRALARIHQATPYFARRQMLSRRVSRKFFVAKFFRYTVYH